MHEKLLKTNYFKCLQPITYTRFQSYNTEEKNKLHRIHVICIYVCVYFNKKYLFYAMGTIFFTLRETQNISLIKWSIVCEMRTLQHFKS